MNIKTLSLVVVCLLFIQFMVIWGVTKANKALFNNHPATDYSQAVAELAKKKPVAGFIVQLCYGLSLLELVVLLIAKYS